MKAHSPTTLVIKHSYASFLEIDWKELLLYGWLVFSLLGDKLGLELPLFGFAWLALLAMLALTEKGQNNRQRMFLGLIWITAGIYVTIQIFIFGLRIQEPYVKPFVHWCLMAAVIFGFINRPNFIKRLATVIFLNILISWPSVVWTEGSHEILRASAEGTGISNPNDFAAWTGFCVLMFWLWSLVQANNIIRLLLWTLAILGTIIVMQTVSRGTMVLLGAAFLLSLVPLKLKRKLKIMVFCGAFCFVALGISFIHQRATDYETRMFDETGRIATFPVAIEAFVEHPWFGIGADELDLYVPERTRKTAPHNGFLTIAVSAGIFPLITFIILWLLVCLNAMKYRHETGLTNPLPLVIFALGVNLVSNIYFINIWAVAIMFYSAGVPKPQMYIFNKKRGRASNISLTYEEIHPRLR